MRALLRGRFLNELKEADTRETRMHKTIATGTALLITIFIGDWATAGTQKLQYRYSESQLHARCDEAGGTFNSGSGTGYGCTGSGGQINCDKSGKCTGTCPNCGTPQMGRGGFKGILQSPTAVGNAPPPGNPPKGRNPIAGGSTVTNPNLLSGGGGAGPTTSSKIKSPTSGPTLPTSTGPTMPAR
jgi:hypothetical protein